MESIVYITPAEGNEISGQQSDETTENDFSDGRNEPENIIFFFLEEGPRSRSKLIPSLTQTLLLPSAYDADGHVEADRI